MEEVGRASQGEEVPLHLVLQPMNLRFLYKEGQHDTS